MKLQVFFFLFLGVLPLFAQSGSEVQKAKKLHQEGIRLLENDKIKAFTKLQALDKFQQAKKILDIAKIAQDSFYKKNDKQLENLVQDFTKYENSDSLLQLTRFYPDSIFQINPRYDSAFKALIIKYLALKNSAGKIAFYQLKSLNYASISTSKIDESFFIAYENYWPFVVLEFEKWLSLKENEFSRFPKKAKSNLLSLTLQSKLDALQNSENTNYNERNRQFLQEKVTKAQEALETAKKDYQYLKYLGLGILGLVLLLGYYFWKKSDHLLKSNNQLLLEEKKRSEDLLSNILPAEVVRQLKTNKPIKAQKYQTVSVLFSDFKNFSQIAKTLSPEELVNELNTCFTIFDRIIEKHRLQKIKTIGDAYMCVSGLYTRGGDHVQRMVSAAIEIQQFLESRKRERQAANQYFFEARIGIHTGPVVAGVIGANKIAFDVWGDTVNVAQQMEHHGEPGQVNISGETHQLIQDKFDFTIREAVTTKNEKTYDMFFVFKKISKNGKLPRHF